MYHTVQAQKPHQQSEKVLPQVKSGSGLQIGGRIFSNQKMKANEPTIRRRLLGQYSAANLTKGNRPQLEDAQAQNEDLDEMNVEQTGDHDATAPLKANKAKSALSMMGTKKGLDKDASYGTNHNPYQNRPGNMKRNQTLETINEESTRKGTSLNRSINARAGFSSAQKRMVRNQSAAEPDNMAIDLKGTQRASTSQIPTQQAIAAAQKKLRQQVQEKKDKNMDVKKLP